MAEPASAEATSTLAEHGVAHVVPFQVLLAVFVALVFLTFATVAATWVDLGDMNLWIALAIATFKAALVALYFMHLRYDHPFNALILVGGLGILALFLALVLLDTFQYQPDVINW
jgi:cytochrome c oxidase subunit 4